ncbi:hypothetical protein ACKWTF_004529 [Chironomus riparius]
MNYKAAIAIAGVLLGCCLDALYLEFAVRYDSGSGNLITFLQFFFIALYGLIFTSKFFTVKPNIPMKDYVLLVTMFFLSSVLNNYALNFHISVPLQMIFRSGSLMANMILGIIILNKSYDFWKYVSVVLITLGIFVSTIASGSDVKKSQVQNAENDKNDSFFWWLFGVLLLSLALFISARMGIYQEVMYKKRGKHPNEALFYTHVLALPAFFLMGKNIWNHMIVAANSDAFVIAPLNISIRIQILYLVINFISHYFCVKCVYILTTECSSLTVTMVVTLRKFASLIFSIIYFQHPFTAIHWIGTVLIIIGTIMFTEIISKIFGSFKSSDLSQSNNDEEDIQTKTVDKETLYDKIVYKSTQTFKSITVPKPHVGYKLLRNSK